LIDLYFLRTLIGISEPESELRNKNLYAYGEFLTDLDPRFFHAYYFLSLATVYSLGKDQYLNGDLALKLVRKGIKQFPRDFRLRILSAFLLTYVEHDPRAAIEEFIEISKFPDAPAGAIAAATSMFVENNDFDAAIAMISAAMDEGGHGSMQLLTDRKKQLEIERLLRELDAAIRAAGAKLGHTPESLDEVVALGEWPAELTHDPHGGELSVQAGRGHSSWLVGRIKGIPQ